MRVILLTIPPQFNPPAYHAVVDEFRRNVNAWIRAQTDVTIVDAETDLKEESWYEDGRHLTPAGTLVLGRKVSEVINAWVATVPARLRHRSTVEYSRQCQSVFAGIGRRKAGCFWRGR
jgi:hypothetical protein